MARGHDAVSSGHIMLQDTFLELLERAERHVREHLTGDFREEVIRDIQYFRTWAHRPDERDVLHAMEKFLVISQWYFNRDEQLRAEVQPYIDIAWAARDRLGGAGLLPLLK